MKFLYSLIFISLTSLLIPVFGQGPFNCVESAYLFQYNDIYAVNLASGTAYLAKENATPGNINAAAYNPADGYLWGSLTSPDQAIVRIGNSFETETFIIPGFPTSNPYVGAINSDGIYYVKPGGTSYYLVDLNPRSAEYLTIIEKRTLSINLSIADWAFNAKDNMLYTVASGSNILYRIDPRDGNITELGEVPILSGLNYTYGAVYFDLDGNFYISANQTGTVYIANRVQSITAGGNISSNLFAFGPSSNSNDGARCPTAPVPQEDCSNGIDDDGDGLVDCDDPSCSGVDNCPVNTGTSSGNNGGLESHNRLSNLISKSQFKKQKSTVKIGPEFQRPMQKPTEYGVQKTTRSAIQLYDFIPFGVIGETGVFESSPSELLDITNASQVFAVDYFKGNKTSAALLALKTEGQVYEHSKYICDRLLGSEILSVSTMLINEQNVIRTIIKRPDGAIEFVISFSGFVNENGMILESHWNLDSYTKDQNYFNFQIWSESIDDLQNLASEIINLIEVQLPVNSYNFSQPPLVYIRKATYTQGKLDLTLMNNFNAQSVQIEGAYTETETSISYDYEDSFNLNPGLNVVRLDIPSFYDFGFRVSTSIGGSPDDLFISDGTWGVDDFASSTVIQEFEVETSSMTDNTDNYSVARNARLRAETNEYVSIYRSLTPRFEAIDLSNFNQLNFKASGEGEMFVSLIKASIEQWEDQPKERVELNPTLQQYTLAFDPEQLEDVTMVLFTFKSEGQTLRTIDVDIQDLEFTHSLSTSLKDLEADFAEFSINPNPVNDQLNLELNQTIEIAQISIYNVNGTKVLTYNSNLQAQSGGLQLDVNELSSGLYIIQVIDQEGTMYNIDFIKK